PCVASRSCPSDLSAPPVARPVVGGLLPPVPPRVARRVRSGGGVAAPGPGAGAVERAAPPQVEAQLPVPQRRVATSRRRLPTPPAPVGLQQREPPPLPRHPQRSPRTPYCTPRSAHARHRRGPWRDPPGT